MFEEFLEIAKYLNEELNIIPVLYGSLGLEVRTSLKFKPQDIDILVPKEYLNEYWNSLKKTISKMGYTFIDLHEHEFHRDKTKIAFAEEEDLWKFAGIKYHKLEVRVVDGAKFKLLNEAEYLKVYSKSIKDGYRRTKNNNKDKIKIEILESLINQR